ncbi:MAG: 5'/3'-nucleotidase SurE [Endomicrobiia bacterium]
MIITNDDGIFGLGLFPLIKELSSLGEIFVIVPEKEMSAASHSLSLFTPVRVRPIIFNNQKIHLVSGTPVDCVRVGFIQFQKQKTDIVVAGINQGANLGQDVIYSGTVAAAREAMFLGTTGIAVSLIEKGKYNYVSKVVKEITKLVYEKKFKGLLNINFPNKSFKGIKITTLGERRYKNVVHVKKDPLGFPYYWLKSDLIKNVNINKKSDIYAVSKGYISITPIITDLTDKPVLTSLEKIFSSIKI